MLFVKRPFLPPGLVGKEATAAQKRLIPNINFSYAVLHSLLTRKFTKQDIFLWVLYLAGMLLNVSEL